MTRRTAFLLLPFLVAACGGATPSPAMSPASNSPSPVVTLSAANSASLSAAASPALSPSAAPSATVRVPTSVPVAVKWRPSTADTLQVQYTGALDTSVDATIYDLDGDATSAATVANLHAAGRHVLCYIDAGSWEKYRADAAAYPTGLLGNVMEGWPNERWVDIRRIDLLGPLLRARLDTCAAKGFDGVDPDNVDGYTNKTGFALTAADQLKFNGWLAAEAHRRGLAIVLKNDGDQSAALLPYFDAAVVEQCVEYSECASYALMVEASRPVFDIEYSRTPAVFCKVAESTGIKIIGKRVALDAYRAHC